MPNYGTTAEAVATRYAPGTVPAAPAGAIDIVSSSANLPPHLGQLPAVLVFPDQGTLEAGNGSRYGVTSWLVRLYYSQVAAGDLEGEIDQLRDWLTLLVDVHKAAVQLGGLVVVTRTVGWRVGVLPYGGRSYTGIELRVETVTAEPWDATA